MQCFRAKKLLSSYLEGHLDKHSSMQLEEHLAGCVACRRQMDDLAMLVNELQGLESVKAPSDFLDQIHARLAPPFRRHNLIKKLFHPWRIKIPLELASAVALALLVVAVIGIQKEEKPISQKPKMVVSRSAHEQEADTNGLSPTWQKSIPMPAAKQDATDRTKTGLKSIVLTVLVKSHQPDRLDEPMAVQDVTPKPYHGKAAGLEETENGLLSRFSKQKPGEDKIKERAPDKSPGAADTSDQDKRKVRDKYRSDPDLIFSRVQALVQSMAGDIISERETGRTQDLRQITVDIPASRYPEFIDELSRMAPFQTPPPTIARDQESIRIQIRLTVSQK